MFKRVNLESYPLLLLMYNNRNFKIITVSDNEAVIFIS